MTGESQDCADSMSQLRPIDPFRGDDRALDTDPAEVGRAVSLADRDDATEADAEAARHLVLQGDVAGNIVLLDQPCQGGQHAGRPAADDLGGAIAARQPSGQQIRDKAVVTGGAVVGRQLDLDASAVEVIDARQERGRPHPVQQGGRGGEGRLDLLRRRFERLLAVVCLAEPPTSQGQEWRLANTAGHEEDRSGGWRAEAVAERPPDRQPLARPALGESGRASPHHEVDHVERGGRAGRSRITS